MITPTKHEAYADAFAALQWGPKTRDEIAEAAGISHVTAARFISELRSAGVVRRNGYITPTNGRPEEVFELQTKPFAVADFDPFQSVTENTTKSCAPSEL